MALRASIVGGDGVTCTYHRIASMNVQTNARNLLQVCGYLDEAGRQRERDHAAAIARGEPEAAGSPPYTETRYYTAPYDQEMTIAGAYGWLKDNVEEFEDAEDVI